MLSYITYVTLRYGSMLILKTIEPSLRLTRFAYLLQCGETMLHCSLRRQNMICSWISHRQHSFHSIVSPKLSSVTALFAFAFFPTLRYLLFFIGIFALQNNIAIFFSSISLGSYHPAMPDLLMKKNPISTQYQAK